jgi:hypothetical protein
VQGEFVTGHSPGTPGPIRATCTCHGRLHYRPGCRAAARCRQRLAAPRLLLHEEEPSPAEVQRIRSRTPAVYEALKHFRHMLEARHFTIFTDHKLITPSSRSGTNARRGSLITSISSHNSAQTWDTFLDRTTLSPTLSLASNLSPRLHPTTHWPHRRRATASFENCWRLPRQYDSRSSKFPAPQSPFTATCLPGNLGRTSQALYGSKSSSPSMICLTQVRRQQQDWLHMRFVWPGM